MFDLSFLQFNVSGLLISFLGKIKLQQQQIESS